jgi:uncharacterized protein YndB with AHSA1/START domain
MTAAAAPRARTEMKPDVDLTRVFHAPKSLVWRAWTDPKALKEWYGPHFFTAARAEVDLRVWGEVEIVLQGPDGARYPMTSTFEEITPEDRLVMVNRLYKDRGGFKLIEVRSTVTFTEERGRTTVHVREDVQNLEARYTLRPTSVPRDLRSSEAALWFARGNSERMEQSLERLGGHLGSLTLDIPPHEPVVWISRIFKAPRELVWRALTDAEHLKHWWGPRDMKTLLCEMDARPGGSWRVHQVVAAEESIGGTPAGTVIKFKGKVLEVVPPEKLVQTFGVEGMYEGNEIVETITLTDLGNGRTLYKSFSDAVTFEAREAVIASGMSYGANEMFDRLDEHLPKMRA